MTKQNRWWRWLLIVGSSLLVMQSAVVGCEPTTIQGEPVAERDLPPDAPVPETSDPNQRIVYSEERAPCKEFHPYRKAYFGDLHVHGAYSFDANAYQSKVTPADAYRFATGGTVELPPFDAQGKGRPIQLKRALDFAAVTEHAEFLGEVAICSTPGSPGYDSDICQKYRVGDDNSVTNFGVLLAGEPNRLAALCGPNGTNCLDLARKRWASIVKAAQDAYDKTEDCKFVSLIGYEYTSTPGVSNVHRNVIFRNHNVPDLPISFYEQSTPFGLWRALKAQCLDGIKDCDAITIGHNSNLSNGKMYTPDYTDKEVKAKQQEDARLRLLFEPLIEMMQHKGSMECRNGLAHQGGKDDPFCNFEKMRDDKAVDCGDTIGNFGMRRAGCVSWLDFARGILKAGLQEDKRIGVNPYQLGLIGSTDTHNGIAGYTDERTYPGHIGTVDDSPTKRLGKGNFTHDALINNPGGLAVVWAKERSRDGLFNAFRRRETYATSGTRIAVRFFGGWAYPKEICGDATTLPQTGYQQGVPMGSMLTTAPNASSSPTFVVHATQDPGTSAQPGTPLQQIQIIKAWLDKDGQPKEEIFTIAGDPKNGATVDPKTCKTSGKGAETLCATWQDPAFDPQRRAFYYARVIENPTCRWSTYTCNTFAADKRPEACDNGTVPHTIQERAWTSPIWYQPQ